MTGTPDKIQRFSDIGSFLLLECTGITEIKLPPSLNKIGNKAFYGDVMLESIDIPDSVASIGNYAFYGCTGMTEAKLPSDISTIEKYTFSGCTGLTSVTVPESVTLIGEQAFSDCTNLNSVTLPKGLKTINKNAFKNCTSLVGITIPKTVTKIDSTAFDGLETLTIYGVAGTAAETFANEKGFTFVDITNKVTSITLSDTALTLNTGNAAQLSATLETETEDLEITDDLVWSSDNESVATVDESGKITAVSAGTAVITLTAGSCLADCRVTVLQPVTSVGLNQSAVTLSLYKSAQLTATVAPANASDKGVVWTSSNPAVATVTANGLVKAVGVGTAVITAMATDESSIARTCTINVNPVLKGETYTVSGLNYRITNAGTNGTGTVSVMGAAKNTITSLKVGSTVAINGVNFKITSVDANAFRNYKKLKKGTVGSGAFKGIKSKCVFKVPKAKVSASHTI